MVAAQIREIIRQRGSYGYRRVTDLVNCTFDTAYTRKRIRCHGSTARQMCSSFSVLPRQHASVINSLLNACNS